MKSGLIATGLATALAISGHADRPAPKPVRQEVKDVVDSPKYQRLGYEFNGIDPSQLKDLAIFTFKASGLKHRINAYTDGAPNKTEEKAARLYANIQIGILRATKHFSEINLRLLNPGQGTQEHINQTVNVGKAPTDLLMLPANSFATPDHATEPGFTIQAPFAKGINNSLSLVETSINTRPYDINIGAEACNAVVYVHTAQPDIQLQAQEVTCNSLGVAYEMAQLGYSYPQYTEEVDKSPAWTTTSGGSINYFMLSDAVYSQIQSNKVPSNLDNAQP